MTTFITNTLMAFWTTLCEMAPYLLFGFLVAGILYVFISPRTVERHLGGSGLWPVFKASLFGVPLPLCSCSVIPVTTSLRTHGASKAASLAFLLSTPQTGVDSIAATYALLGPVFAVFRPLAALIIGFIGGAVTAVLDKDPKVNGTMPRCQDECCTGSAIKTHALIRMLRYAFITLPADIGKPLLGGIVVAALMNAIIPDNYFAEKLGTGIWPMVVMMAIGIPMYVCATASVPVALALMMKGVSPGAALVFLMTGPATNAAGVMTIWKIMGRRTAVIYLVTIAVTALASGWLLDALFTMPAIAHAHAEHTGHMALPAWANAASGIALVAIIAWAYVAPRLSRKADACCSAEILKETGSEKACPHCH